MAARGTRNFRIAKSVDANSAVAPWGDGNTPEAARNSTIADDGDSARAVVFEFLESRPDLRRLLRMQLQQVGPDGTGQRAEPSDETPTSKPSDGSIDTKEALQAFENAGLLRLLYQELKEYVNSSSEVFPGATTRDDVEDELKPSGRRRAPDGRRRNTDDAREQQNLQSSVAGWTKDEKSERRRASPPDGPLYAPRSPPSSEKSNDVDDRSPLSDRSPRYNRQRATSSSFIHPVSASQRTTAGRSAKVCDLQDGVRKPGRSTAAHDLPAPHPKARTKHRHYRSPSRSCSSPRCWTCSMLPAGNALTDAPGATATNWHIAIKIQGVKDFLDFRDPKAAQPFKLVVHLGFAGQRFRTHAAQVGTHEFLHKKQHAKGRKCCERNASSHGHKRRRTCRVSIYNLNTQKHLCFYEEVHIYVEAIRVSVGIYPED
eukprot:GHVT01065513.1.p1 GENE.GHVT01065513.1~~GHVT01065513.1.p1  ORF type:complete len:429 (+),score=52.35 GHVT01065513.1:4099-5385(+)